MTARGDRVSVLVVTLFASAGLATPTHGQAIPTPEYGPPNGTLIIDGGNPSAEVRARFIALGGGAENGRFVIVPTGGGNRDASGELRTYDEERVTRAWHELGLKHVRMLHTADPRVADSEAFVEPLLDATAVWFSGGRQWNYVDSYSGTRTLVEFHRVLERGGVIAGGSAGASIQGDYLVRGDTRGAEVVMTDEPEHQRGFAFLRRSAIDQHINTRNRWDDLVPVVQRFPNLLGIGLSEGTAIVVTGDTFEVVGVWKVTVHDNTRAYQPWEKPYFVLSAGDVYNMRTRSVEALGNGTGCAAPTWPTGWVTVADTVLEQYVGAYDPLTVFRRESQLFAQMPAGTAELDPVSDTEFMIRRVGTPVRFETDATGRVVAAVMRQNCNERRLTRIER